MESVDKTIDALCNCIQEKINDGVTDKESELTTVLANLITARARTNEDKTTIEEKKVKKLEQYIFGQIKAIGDIYNNLDRKVNIYVLINTGMSILAILLVLIK